MDQERSSQAIQREGSGTKSLQEALGYVSSAWFPVNVQVLEQIRAKLAGGEYGHDHNLLLQDLRGDLALFTYCIRSLGERVGTADRDKHPITVFRELPLEEIGKILAEPVETMSSHSMTGLSRFQAQRLRHTLISSSAVEVLAQKGSIDEDIAFCSALTRQLGFLLAAWNYPRTFAKALSALNPQQQDLEPLLFKFLGFSPTQIGYKLLAEWCTNPDFLVGNPVAMGSDAPEATKELAQLCDVGEALARVNDPEHYVAGKREWQKVLADICDYAGKEGLELIRDRISRSGTHYQVIMPQLFTLDALTPPPQVQRQAGLAAPSGESMIAANVAVRKCEPEIRAHFSRVYELIIPGQVSVEALNLLVKEVIPALGFNRGCVYLAHPETAVLTPRLKIGDCDINRFKTLRSSSSKFSHPVIEALHCQNPIRQENVIMYGEFVSHVTGVFGTREKTGVLYLEMGPALVQREALVPLMYFKAVRQALNDCLNLREPVS